MIFGSLNYVQADFFLCVLSFHLGRLSAHSERPQHTFTFVGVFPFPFCPVLIQNLTVIYLVGKRWWSAENDTTARLLLLRLSIVYFQHIKSQNCLVCCLCHEPFIDFIWQQTKIYVNVVIICHRLKVAFIPLATLGAANRAKITPLRNHHWWIWSQGTRMYREMLRCMKERRKYSLVQTDFFSHFAAIHNNGFALPVKSKIWHSAICHHVKTWFYNHKFSLN